MWLVDWQPVCHMEASGILETIFHQAGNVRVSFCGPALEDSVSVVLIGEEMMCMGIFVKDRVRFVGNDVADTTIITPPPLESVEGSIVHKKRDMGGCPHASDEFLSGGKL